MTTKQPWEEKLYETNGQRSQKNQKGNLTGLIFTIMLTIFVVVVVLMVGISIYLSTGGSQNESASTSFYNPETAASSQPAPEEQPVEEEVETQEESEGNTLTVEAGEGAAAIANRAGISVERLYELNPEYMTSGYWYANPGDVVKID